ncbi:MAG: hypothetical protein AB7T38_09045 [Nitrospirales bacterium]
MKCAGVLSKREQVSVSVVVGLVLIVTGILNAVPANLTAAEAGPDEQVVSQNDQQVDQPPVQAPTTPSTTEGEVVSRGMGLATRVLLGSVPPAGHTLATVTATGPEKLVGGGAFADWRGAGSLLTASAPTGLTGWEASAKDHGMADPSALTAYAILLSDPGNMWEVTMREATSPVTAHASISVTSPPGSVMASGGCRVNWKTAPTSPGNLLTASFPSSTTTWECRAQDHSYASPASVTAYVVAIRPRNPATPLPQIQIDQATSAVGAHPAVQVHASRAGYVVTGGGAQTLVLPGAAGQLLTQSAPLTEGGKATPRGWTARSKDHLVSSPGTVVAYVISLDLNAAGSGGAMTQAPQNPTGPPDTAPIATSSSVSNQQWAADVGITMRATANSTKQEISYELTIVNHGKDIADDVRLAFALREPGPPGVRVKEAPSKKICRAFDVHPGNPVVTCSVPRLTVGQSLTVNVVLANPGNGPRYSMAQVMTVTPDPNQANNWATNIGQGVAASPNGWLADLAVSLTGTTDPANQVQTYQLGVTNQGDDNAREIILAHAFTNAVPGTSVVRIDPRGGATCTSKEMVPGLPVLTCTVPQLGNQATAGATVVFRNPGNMSRTSSVQAMSLVPDFNRGNNVMTITVPQGTAPQDSQATPPPPTAPSGMVLSPFSPAIGGSTHMILQPKVTAPVQQPTSPTAPTQIGKYRVVINGLRISHPTVDNALNSDGWGDEIYVAAAARLYDLQKPQGQRLVDAGVVKSLVHGQQNSIGSRIMAGHRTASGGITGNDWVPSVDDPRLPHGTPSFKTFPFVVYEGPLTDSSLLIINPTLWEYDGSSDTYQRWEQRWKVSSGGLTATLAPAFAVQMAFASDPAANAVIQRQMQIQNIEVTMGLLLEDIVHAPGDRPIGLERIPPPTTGNPLQSHPPIVYSLRDRYVVLTRKKIETELSSPSSIGNVPPVLITIPFIDGPPALPIGGIQLQGNYTMYLRVEKLP